MSFRLCFCEHLASATDERCLLPFLHYGVGFGEMKVEQDLKISFVLGFYCLVYC